MTDGIDTGGRVHPVGYGGGITLRDYAAVKAMAGLLADPYVRGSVKQVAKISYEMADAMVEEKRRTEK